MVFNSFEFLVFLPAVFLLYWTACRGRTARNLLLIAASYVFYGWWNPVFLLLIFITTAVSYLCGIAVGETTSAALRRTAFAVCLVVNLGILGIYKYFDFFAKSFAEAMGALGWETDAVTLGLILPVGISFYTFQAIGYVIDVKRGSIKPTHDAAAFFAFISFFPQLVAGPIERATNLLPQFLRDRSFDYKGSVEGMRLMLWGLFKKMVVADNCAPVVDKIFSGYAEAGSAALWTGAFLFSIQIYCDFSGYSDIAVGVARLFNVRLMRNFKLPYFSRSIDEFWQRWHISLTSWFRDYLYIPLGGNRRGKLRRIRNTAIVFLTSGLWHGANLTFVAWGAYHALFFIPSSLRRGKPARRLGILGGVLAMGLTFLLVAIGWIIFRSDTITDALHYIRRMFSFLPPDTIPGKRAIAWSAVMLAADWLGRRHESPVDLLAMGPGRNRCVRWGLYALLFITVLVFAGSAKQFIYFQF